LIISAEPQEWAPYIIQRAEDTARSLQARRQRLPLLSAVDRTSRTDVGIPIGSIGASRSALPTTIIDPAYSRQHLVGSIQSLNAALASAEPGDVIELLPGHYLIDGRGIGISRGGRQDFVEMKASISTALDIR